MAAAKIAFYQKPTCTTCRKAKAVLEELKLEFQQNTRDLDKERLSESEFDRSEAATIRASSTRETNCIARETWLSSRLAAPRR